MQLIVGNIVTQAVIGGTDHLRGDVYKMLRELLRVRPNNYGQILMTMKRRGNAHGWDGYTYFINKKGMFPTGFLPQILNFCLQNTIKVTLVDNRKNVPVLKDRINIRTPKFKLAEHQINMLLSLDKIVEVGNHSIYFPRGTWKAATNSGKTAVFGSVVKNVVSPCALLLVADQGLMRQHYEYYSTVFTKPGDVACIKSDSYSIGNILTIAMVKTLRNRLKKSPTVQRDLNNKFNILGVDESHEFSARDGLYVINHINAGMRIFMSGSPFDMADKVSKLRLVGMSGATICTVSKRYLMDNGFSMIPKVRVYLNPTRSLHTAYLHEFEDCVIASEQRAELIADIIMKRRSKKIMITFNFERHGRLMYETFCSRYPSLAYLADWVHGDDPDRNQKVQDFMDDEIRILFSSTILQQGYNFPDVQVVINAMGGKAMIPLNQWMGRGERLDGVNKYFEWIEIFDQGKYMTKHSKQRIRFLVKEDLPEPIRFMYNNKRGVPIK